MKRFTDNNGIRLDLWVFLVVGVLSAIAMLGTAAERPGQRKHHDHSHSDSDSDSSSYESCLNCKPGCECEESSNWNLNKGCKKEKANNEICKTGNECCGGRCDCGLCGYQGCCNASQPCKNDTNCCTGLMCTEIESSPSSGGGGHWGHHDNDKFEFSDSYKHNKDKVCTPIPCAPTDGSCLNGNCCTGLTCLESSNTCVNCSNINSCSDDGPCCNGYYCSFRVFSCLPCLFDGQACNSSIFSQTNPCCGGTNLACFQNQNGVDGVKVCQPCIQESSPCSTGEGCCASLFCDEGTCQPL